MAKLIKVWKTGKTQVCCIQGEYKGEKTYSFTLQKNTYNTETKEHGKSEFFTAPDLRDLNLCISKVILGGVKVKDITPREEPREEPVNEPIDEPVEGGNVADEEVPF